MTEKNYDKSLKKTQSFLEEIFTKIQLQVPEMWGAGNYGPKAFISMNIGVFSIIRLCDYILKYRAEEGDDFYILSSIQIADNVWTCLTFVIEHIGLLSDQDLQTYRGYSTGGINETAVKELLVVLNRNFTNINPDILKNYLTENQTGFNIAAGPLLQSIEPNLKSIIIKILEIKFPDTADTPNGQKQWYLSGVPTAIKTKCAMEWSNSSRVEPEWNFFYLTDYKEIIMLNKNELLPVFTKNGDEQKQDPEKLSWYNRLILLTNNVNLPSRKPIDKSDFEELKEIDDWLKGKLV